jgi:hypothetical protein
MPVMRGRGREILGGRRRAAEEGYFSNRTTAHSTVCVFRGNCEAEVVGVAGRQADSLLTALYRNDQSLIFGLCQQH